MASIDLDLREKLQAAIAAHPSKMTLQLSRDFAVPEVEVIRAFPDNRSVELNVKRWEEIIRDLEAFGTVHVIVSNGAATIEAVGAFGNFSTWGEFFNVQTKTLDMHIRYAELGAILAVEKPSHMSGINTLSIQFFDRRGDAAMKVFLNFGTGEPDSRLSASFAELRERFRI